MTQFFNYHGKKVTIDQYLKLRLESGELKLDQVSYTMEDIRRLGIKLPKVKKEAKEEIKEEAKKEAKEEIKEEAKKEVKKEAKKLAGWIRDKFVNFAKELDIKRPDLLKDDNLLKKIKEKTEILPDLTEKEKEMLEKDEISKKILSLHFSKEEK